MKHKSPLLVYSDGCGNIFEDTQMFAAGRSGTSIYPLSIDNMIPLPEGSDLFELPGRKAFGYNKMGDLIEKKQGNAVSAFISPAHTQLSLAAWRNEPNAPVLPLYAYTAVGWHKGKFYVPAVRIDPDERQDCQYFNQKVIIKRGKEILKKYPKNRLVEHIVQNCAFTYLCPAARNFVMDRWEAPVPISPSCNARCIGCISKQDESESPISPTQHRLTFVPSVSEIIEFAVPHLENAPRAIISFGQGCEGEPLMQWELIRDVIVEVRKRTNRGIINLNTNGSNHKAVEELFRVGLDSIRVSMNSAQDKWYNLYFRPVNYTRADAVESLKIARRYGRWASINYFVMPGLTDTEPEIEALNTLIADTQLSMIQWRNFNIDPDWFFTRMEYNATDKHFGVENVMKRIKQKFPQVYFGYFNPPSELIQLKKQ
jgi:pyruvate-formate lyase-activating enzyme